MQKIKLATKYLMKKKIHVTACFIGNRCAINHLLANFYTTKLEVYIDCARYCYNGIINFYKRYVQEIYNIHKKKLKSIDLLK